MAAMVSVSLSSASLRSSTLIPCLLCPRNVQIKRGRNDFTRSPRSDRGRCVAQMAESRLVEFVQSGIGPEVHVPMIQFYHDVLFSAVKLGVPLPVDDNTMAFWAIGLPAALLYATATPGPIAGLADFVLGFMSANSPLAFRAYEVEVGRRMGEGSFGVVYEGSIYKGERRQEAGSSCGVEKEQSWGGGGNEMRDAEIHMNRRLQGIWLIWKFQGYRTLDHYMKQKNFPENIAEAVLGQEIQNNSSAAAQINQHTLVIQKIMQQVLTNLRDMHRSGVVNRDLKPLNLVLCEDTGSFKFIDLGACVDLRSGFNYTPDETVIDPIYAAPEHYVMPTSTPTLPPDPLCSLISPFVWLLNTPDRFDIFSAGLILMQLSVKQLRQDVGLRAFNTQLKRAQYDLDVWRERCNISSDEFAILDADGGAGWELAKSMLQPRHGTAGLRSSRPSAAAALRHRFIEGTPLPRSIRVPKLAPDLASLPSPRPLPSTSSSSLPSISSAPFLPSLGQLQGPAFSRRSAGESTVVQTRNVQGSTSNVGTKRISSGSGASLRTAASSVFVLATGWMALTALNNSAHLSYDMGRWIFQTVGLSGSVCLSFFLIVKPWLEEQERTSRRERELQSFFAPEQISPIEIAVPDSPMHDTGNLLPTGEQRGTSRFETGLSEAVLGMAAQLISLEASIQREQQFSAQQRESLARMKKLLVLSRGVEYAPSSEEAEGDEGADIPLSVNGAYGGKPFSEYIG